MASPLPEHRLVLWGAGLGLASAIGMGILRTLNASASEPASHHYMTLLMVAILATAHVAALFTLSAPSAARGPILLAAAFLSTALLGISLASIGIVFLPSAVLYYIPTFRVFRRTEWMRGAVLLLVAIAVVASGLIVYAAIILLNHPTTPGDAKLRIISLWLLGSACLAGIWPAGFLLERRRR